MSTPKSISPDSRKTRNTEVLKKSNKKVDYNKKNEPSGKIKGTNALDQKKINEIFRNRQKLNQVQALAQKPKDLNLKFQFTSEIKNGILSGKRAVWEAKFDKTSEEIRYPSLKYLEIIESNNNIFASNDLISLPPQIKPTGLVKSPSNIRSVQRKSSVNLLSSMTPTHLQKRPSISFVHQPSVAALQRDSSICSLMTLDTTQTPSHQDINDSQFTILDTNDEKILKSTIPSLPTWKVTLTDIETAEERMKKLEQSTEIDTISRNGEEFLRKQMKLRFRKRNIDNLDKITSKLFSHSKQLNYDTTITELTDAVFTNADNEDIVVSFLYCYYYLLVIYFNQL